MKKNVLETARKFSYSESRFRKTVKFIGNIRGHILDIGERNNLTNYIEDKLNVSCENTKSDLDYSIDYDLEIEKFDVIFCFEVIEHLLNPRLFFDNLYKITKDDGKVILSYPSRPKIFWNNEEHFHEYDRLRFNYLLKKTGFRIVRKKNIYVKRTPNGIRPLIRNFIPQTTIYELRKNFMNS